MTPADPLVIVAMALAVYTPKALPLVVVSEGLATLAVVTLLRL